MYVPIKSGQKCSLNVPSKVHIKRSNVPTLGKRSNVPTLGKRSNVPTPGKRSNVPTPGKEIIFYNPC